MERIYRVLFLGLFILGFVGTIASAGRQNEEALDRESLSALIHDIRFAQEVNALNAGRWTLDVEDNKEDGLARAEQLLSEQALQVSKK